jgi:hypothetical protein
VIFKLVRLFSNTPCLEKSLILAWVLLNCSGIIRSDRKLNLLSITPLANKITPKTDKTKNISNSGYSFSADHNLQTRLQSISSGSLTVEKK